MASIGDTCMPWPRLRCNPVADSFARFWGNFWPTLKGMKEIYGPDPSIFRDYVPDIAAFLEEEKVPGESVICVGKISHPGQSSYISQFEYLKSITPKERHGEIKLTLAAPNWYHLRYREGQAYPKDVYATDEVN